MPRVQDATRLYMHGSVVGKVMAYGQQVWPAFAPIARSAFPPTSGSVSGTSVTAALPTGWTSSDYLILWFSSNNARPITVTAGVASATLLGTSGDRLAAWHIVPSAGATTITFTVTTSTVMTWAITGFAGVDPAATVLTANATDGTNSTSTTSSPAIDLAYLATGGEMVVSAANVNSTATWTTDANTIYATTANNGAFMVEGNPVPAGRVTAPGYLFDRGSAGSARNESTLTLVLSPVHNQTPSRLVNGGFELGGGLVATGWSTEHSAPHDAVYSRTTTGAVSGNAQRMQFTGTTGDTGMVAIYQAPITAAAGEILTFTMALSGSLTNCYAIMGIESFVTPGGTYISEGDTTVTVLTPTPTLYTVTYTIPATATAAAVYVQVPDVGPSAVVDMYMDEAALIA